MSHPHNPNEPPQGWGGPMPPAQPYLAQQQPNPYGYAPYPAQQYEGHPTQGYTTGYPPAKTNGLALGALITSLAGAFLCVVCTIIFPIGGILGIVGTIVGAILGHVSRGQVKRTGERGAGMALAAVIVGWVVTGLYIVFVVLVVGLLVVFANSSSL